MIKTDNQIENTWKNILRYWEREREIAEIAEPKKLTEKNILNLDNWKLFSIGQLFTITRGKRIVREQDYEKNIVENFKIPVITTTTVNNGIDGYYIKSNSKGNVLITCGEASGMFTTYQKNPVWALDTVRILDPKFKFNKNIALFLIPILNANMFRFSYGRKAKPSHVRSIKIKLPVDKNGNPDWEYMENYIKSLPYSKYI